MTLEVSVSWLSAGLRVSGEPSFKKKLFAAGTTMVDQRYYPTNHNTNLNIYNNSWEKIIYKRQ